jgi:two-component system, cell cycle response regulator DivK
MMNTARRVLLVEDFDDSRFSLSKLLEIEGYEVLEAVDGAEAIDLAKKTNPDLILMDLTLPVVDGLSATRQIRAYEPLHRVPIIALSAHDVDDYKAIARDAGCTDYITKPIDFNNLMTLMTKYLPA